MAVLKLRADPVTILAVGLGIRYFGISFYNPFILVYLHSILGVPLTLAGLDVAAVNVAVLPAPILGGGLADRFGRRRLVLLSLAGEAGGPVFLSAAMRDALLLGMLLALFAILASGVVGSPASSAYVADSAEPTERAKSFAWLRVGQNSGFTAGIAAGGVLLV
jgi:MFS transporter, DHA1 family, tetracycline resistance protein